MAEYDSTRPKKLGPLQKAWDEMDDERRRLEVTLGYGQVKNAPFHVRARFDELVQRFEQLKHTKKKLTIE